MPAIMRRSILQLATALAPVVLGWDLAKAEAPDGILRVGMTASAVPLSNGCPDQGAEGQRFMASPSMTNSSPGICPRRMWRQP